MPEPFIFVTQHTVNRGARENIAELARTFTGRVEAADTGLVEFHFNMNEDGTEVSNVQVHRDAASMDAYLPLVRDLIGAALELSTTSSITVYGTPGPVLQEVLHQNAEQGVPVVVMSNHLDGFTRAA